jgi:hypothetical protein
MCPRPIPYSDRGPVCPPGDFVGPPDFRLCGRPFAISLAVVEFVRVVVGSVRLLVIVVSVVAIVVSAVDEVYVLGGVTFPCCFTAYVTGDAAPCSFLLGNWDTGAIGVSGSVACSATVPALA